MDDYTDAEIIVLINALEELKDLMKHYPQEFTPSEAESTEELLEAFLQEARYRSIIS